MCEEIKMELSIVNSNNKLEVADTVFSTAYNMPLIHQIVTAYLAGGRAGTKAQKTRAEVSGGGIKPWKQKGTGRARAGTTRSPIWRKGGVTFAAKPRSYAQKVNKKMFKGAMCSIFSEIIRQERLSIVESMQLSAPKTKDFMQLLNSFNFPETDKKNKKILIICESVDMNLYLSARNLPNVYIYDVLMASSDPVALVNADQIIITQSAMKEFEELLS